MVGVFHGPLAPRQGGQPGLARLGSGQTGDKEPSVLGGFPLLLVGRGVAGIENLAGAGKGQCVGVDGGPAHGAGFDPAPVELDLDKRGVAPASFFWAFCRTVGWLSLTPRA